jgi:hypothetical protein
MDSENFSEFSATLSSIPSSFDNNAIVWETTSVQNRVEVRLEPKCKRQHTSFMWQLDILVEYKGCESWVCSLYIIR